MVSRSLLFSSLFLNFATSWAYESSNLKRDETPGLPFDPNTSKYCTWWYDNDGSVSCSGMPGAWGMSLADFLRWNPSLTASCGNFVTGKSYCVEAFGEPPPVVTTTSSTTPTPTGGNGIATPTPIQQNMVKNCDAFHLTVEGDQCGTIAAKYGISLSQFYSWNPDVGTSCGGLWLETYVCVSIIGVNPPSSTAAPTPTNGISTPSPIQTGMVGNCDLFYKVASGDECGNIATKYGITLTQFYTWNPAVGSTCNKLQADVYVCVSIIGQTQPTQTPTPTNGITTPLPIQTGMNANCDVFYKVVSGDQCGTIASKNGISLSQFYGWNPAVGTSCTALQADVYVCVSIIGHTPPTPTPTNGITTPSPIQTGMVGNCDAFHKVISGDQCGLIATKYGISLSQFYAWNAAVGTTCAGLQADTWVCVSIIGVGPTPVTTLRTTTSSGNGVATPTPIQSGMVTNCKTFKKVVSGDECGTIASKAGISLANFYKWNPGVGSSCGSLWLDYYVCIAIL
ncbi:carbohydrate-binding module family 50 protein [Amniculicola lignicola CBS 123094]|uniref:Carbohydrate-binding module family 50 protein n=1 Tax=Amniculicola lignicola CBS 123094 TaxID=1392246 RepID=A0A6A5WRA7_9PLEO|nr:carbohydrate-binding module family 50 protein [Amniculicola lignicola CBS 123094]